MRCCLSPCTQYTIEESETCVLHKKAMRLGAGKKERRQRKKGQKGKCVITNFSVVHLAKGRAPLLNMQFYPCLWSCDVTLNLSGHMLCTDGDFQECYCK